MTEGQVINARRRPASVVEREKSDLPDYFLDYAFERVKELAAGFPTNSLIAKTTLDPSLQKAAEESVAFHLRQYGEDYRANQAAMGGDRIWRTAPGGCRWPGLWREPV